MIDLVRELYPIQRVTTTRLGKTTSGGIVILQNNSYEKPNHP